MSRLGFGPPDDRAVLVTGGARGLGRGIAEALIAEGWRIVVADVRGPAPAGCAFIQTDLREPERAAGVVAAAIELAGPLGGLVNNAGVPAPRATVDQLSGGMLDAVFDVNVRGTALVTAAVAEHLVAQGDGGAVVTITSIGADQPTPGMGAYEASKAALGALTRSAALELAPHGIRVNAVAPGPVATPMTAGLAADPDALAAWTRRIPLGRIAEIADVVPAVLYLLSPLARHVTGTTITVDGGQLLA